MSLQPGQRVWIRRLNGEILPARIRRPGSVSKMRYLVNVPGHPLVKFVLARGELSCLDECRIVAGNPGTGRPLVPAYADFKELSHE